MALFAALAYAVTQTGRGSGGISKEQTALIAAQISSTGSMLRTAVARMVLSGTPVSAIEITTSGVIPPGGAVCALPPAFPFCTTGANCLFAPEGGGAARPNVSASAHSGPGTSQICFDHAAIQGLAGGTLTGNLVFWVDNVSTDICTALNSGLGISGIPPDTGGGSPWVINVGLADPSFFCYKLWDNSRSYIHVLAAN